MNSSPSPPLPTPADPRDAGLPEPEIRKRRRSRRVARVMLTVAVITGIAGWTLYSWSISSAIRIQEQSPSLAIIAYSLLIVSSIMLVLGLWYLLLAQVVRLARMVDADELEESATMPALLCPQCHHPYDVPDRFCRNCGHRLRGTAGEEGLRAAS